MVDYARINSTMGKMMYHLSKHNSICVGVSGGSDSNIIVHIIATYFREFLPKIHFVFCNTGLEYKATLKHLDYLEKHYNIHIDRIRGESVVSVVKKNGFPVLSKHFSYKTAQAQRGAPSALRIVRGEQMSKGKKSTFNFSSKERILAEYIMQNDIKISDKCCNLSKKKPNLQYEKNIKADLHITGERRAEGGIRASQTDCFSEGTNGKIDKYMPLFFWNDETKQYYKEHENIKYSDCYEIWGMKRTGCVGCPFNSKVGEELKLIKQYEPQLYKACINVFGESYELMDKFNIHRQPIFDEQISIFDDADYDDIK